MKMKTKRKVKRIIFIVAPLSIIVACAAFFQFTPFGYSMTIRLRSFTEVEHNIFINNTFSWVTEHDSGDLVGKEGVLRIINESRNRVSELFGGELLSDPIIIISDNPNTFRITGDANTWTMNFHRVFIYISISFRNLNVDIMAHEIAHAELEYRVLRDKPFRRIDSFIPIWFNEGLASVPDYRDFMNEESLRRRLTYGGADAHDVTQLTRADFHDRRARDNLHFAFLVGDYFLLSRHKVLSWLEENGSDGLLRLIDGVRAGEDFNELFFDAR